MLHKEFELILIKIGFFTNFLSCSKFGPKTLYYSTGSLAKFHQKWLGENSSFLYFFLMHIHVLMLRKKFELIPIKIGFFTNFLSCSKIGPKTLYYSTGSLAKFHQKWLGENSSFLYFFLMHIHVLMLRKKFELIPIKIGFFTNFLSCSKIGPKTLYYSTGSLAKFHQKWLGENSSFLYFFLMHIHVLMLRKKFELIPIKIGFFTNFLSCSKIGPKTLYYSTGSLAKFHQKWLGENSSFLYFFLMHIHVLMLHRKFELIPIKNEFLKKFWSCSKIRSKTLYYSTGSLAKFHQKWLGENSSFL